MSKSSNSIAKEVITCGTIKKHLMQECNLDSIPTVKQCGVAFSIGFCLHFRKFEQRRVEGFWFRLETELHFQGCELSGKILCIQGGVAVDYELLNNSSRGLVLYLHHSCYCPLNNFWSQSCEFSCCLELYEFLK